MSQLEQLLQVRHQRQATVAAIQQTEAWIKAHCDTHPIALSKCVSFYVDCTNMQTVHELAKLEAEARAFLLHLQRGV
ncbi:hypothetical protein DEMA109039_05500 [Deinococcus marmoris]